jgi:hypothetical protein
MSLAINLQTLICDGDIFGQRESLTWRLALWWPAQADVN